MLKTIWLGGGATAVPLGNSGAGVRRVDLVDCPIGAIELIAACARQSHATGRFYLKLAKGAALESTGKTWLQSIPHHMHCLTLGNERSAA